MIRCKYHCQQNLTRPNPREGAPDTLPLFPWISTSFIAVLAHACQCSLGHRFVSVETELIVLQAELNLPILQGLLLRREVVHIRVGDYTLDEASLDVGLDDPSSGAYRARSSVSDDSRIGM